MAEYQRSQAKKSTSRREVLATLNEIREDELSHAPAYDNAPAFMEATASYWKAKSLLAQMLVGKLPLSLKDAFYIVENAYGDTMLDYEAYNKTLTESADFIRQWLTGNSLNPENPLALHYGIQAFMADTLTVSVIQHEPAGERTITHLPFLYDYEDFRAEEDFRNYFVTKTLATGTGQCNSLPAAYLLLAEQLGTPAYLSYAPLHSFVKFPDDKGILHNYETTTHFQITDQWYAQHFYISANAYRNRIYLDPLNKQQIVAGAMLDLAYGYLRKHGVADGAFINDCVRQALPFFGKEQANVQGWLLRNTVLAAKLHRVLERQGIRDLKEIAQSPEASKLYNTMLAIEQKLDALGYQELPTDLYKQLMQDQDTKSQQQNVGMKTKHNLFIYSH